MHDSHGADAHHGPDVKLYMAIFVALSVFTGVSFLAYETLPGNISFLIIMAVAVVKAVLVCMYFMHLKWDWGKLYFMVIPCCILATMFVVVLLPDIVEAWHQESVPVSPQR